MGVQERKERERELRRGHILFSAKCAFEKYGVENTSMDRIAQEAELAKGTLYLYFKNRDELLTALVTEMFLSISIELDNLLNSPSNPAEKMLSSVKIFWDFASKNETLMHVMARYDSAKFAEIENNENRCRMVEVNSKITMQMYSIIQEGINCGMFYIEESIGDVVTQFEVAMKGAMIVLRSGMMPPDLMPTDPFKTIQAIAQQFIRGLQFKPHSN